MIIGAHSILYSTDAAADRAFLRDVLKLPNVDVGEGWLIFGLPPAEVAVHPHDANDLHEFYLMCDDVNAFVAEMQRQDVACDAVNDMGWGILTQVRLPGGGKVGVYQPRHARPRSLNAGKPNAGNGARRPTKRSPSRVSKARPAKAKSGSRTASAGRRKVSAKKATTKKATPRRRK